MNCDFNCDLFEQEAKRRSYPWARPCDGCHAAPSAVYCHADAAYLCTSCDTQVHSANRLASSHERVRVCVSCESAAAVLKCHADSAALCTTCDAQVHSANPIAQRHQRVPVLPFQQPLFSQRRKLLPLSTVTRKRERRWTLGSCWKEILMTTIVPTT